jgi:hypothetical protein
MPVVAGGAPVQGSLLRPMSEAGPDPGDMASASDHDEPRGESGDHAAHGAGHGIHMPSPSYYPIIAALGLPLLGYGILYSPILAVDGVLILLAGLFGWALEPGTAEPESELEPSAGETAG